MAAIPEDERPSPPALPRSMGPALATCLVISNVIGVGIFTTSGLLARDLKDPVILLGIWVLGGILALAGAFCYAELGARFPRAGGEYAFLREAYGPLPAFLSGWGSLFAGFSAPIAAASVGFTEYFSSYFPGLSTQGQLSLTARLTHPGNLVAAGIIVLLSAIHYRKVTVGGPIHVVLTGFKVAVIVVFILCGFLLGQGDAARFAPAIPVRDWPALAPAVASGLIFVLFSYSGWNAAAYIGGEIRNPVRNLPRALIAGTVIVIGLYIAINALYIYSIPLPKMASVIRIAELASLNLFGLHVAPFLNIVFMGTILGSISAMVIAGPRVYYAMARDGLFPEAIAKVHPRFGTPGNAIVLQSFWAILLLYIGQFDQLLRYSGVVLVMFSALTVASLRIVRRKEKGNKPGYLAIGYPWSALLFLAVSAWILFILFRDQPKESFAGLIVVGLGVPFYFLWKRRRQSGAPPEAAGTDRTPPPA